MSTVEKIAPHITLRALVLGALTIAVTFYYAITEIQGRGMGGLVNSQLPIIVYVPFVTWLFLNVVLKRFWPAIALKQGELLTIFCMLWLVGTVPHIGWSTYFAIWLAAPAYFATAENQWAEVLFNDIPWHYMPATTDRVLTGFFQGLPQGASIPWDGWYGAVAHWLVVSIAMVIFGFCLVVLLQRQWEEGEKLTFPLAQLPQDLTAGFDGKRSIPNIFASRVFWIGFSLVFLPILYNVGTYFTPGLPTLDVYWKRYTIELGAGYPLLYFRIMPLVMAVTYLCPLDILGSMFLFHLLAVVKRVVMLRFGFTLGSEGVPLTERAILHLESYGTMIFVGLWTFWLARGHLRRVWRQVRGEEGGDPDERRLYRLALVGLAASAAYVLGFMVFMGMSLPLALLAFTVTTLTYLVIMKLIAATGCAYLLTDWDHMKAKTFVHQLVGTAHISPQNYIAYRFFGGRAFFGNLRLPTWPALPHVLKIFSLRHRPRWVVGLILTAFPVGFLVAVASTLEMAYRGDGLAYSSGGTIAHFTSIVTNLANPRMVDPERWMVFMTGFFEGVVLAVLRARYHWFPLHPVGLAFQYTIVTVLYWFSLFLVWLAKLTLLHYGGVRAYLSAKPFFYGLGIGYVVGIILSVTVDLIWFPAAGHFIHGW